MVDFLGQSIVNSNGVLVDYLVHNEKKKTIEENKIRINERAKRIQENIGCLVKIDKEEYQL